MKRISVKENVLALNDRSASRNREIFVSRGIYVVNLVGSPGSGKTSLLERLADYLRDIDRLKEYMQDSVRLAVIEGDLYTDRDARRMEAHNIPVVQVNTGGICHLEASMIQKAVGRLELEGINLLVIENVGNLVCTASFDLGENIMITVMSVTEGDDKPLKYPVIFEKSRIVIVNKVDLLKHTDFNIDVFQQNLMMVNPHISTFRVSCRTGQGIEVLSSYLLGLLSRSSEQ